MALGWLHIKHAVLGRLGTFRGTLALIFLSAILCVLCGALFLLHADSLHGRNATFTEEVWTSYRYFIDPGTQTGLEINNEHTLEVWTAAIISLLGFTLVLVLFGIIVEEIGNVLKRWQRLHARVLTSGHTVVLGWTDKTIFLLGELAQMLSDGEYGGGDIVVLGELDEVEMREEVSISYPHMRRRWPRVRVQFWQGKPYELDDLERVAVSAARHVIVLGGSRQPRVADSHVVSTLCALQTMAEVSSAERGLYGGGDLLHTEANASVIVVEIAMPQNVTVSRQLGGTRVRTVTAHTATDDLVAEATLYPTVGLSIIELMSFAGACARACVRACVCARV